MKRNYFPFTVVLLFMSLSLIAQDYNLQSNDYKSEYFFSILEIVFLIIASIFSLLISIRLKNGKFKLRMALLILGFIVIIFKIDLRNYIWFTLLILTWRLLALSFYKKYNVSKT